jgi:SMC interacting uncharacterized protein involved in chromosome segregation
MSALHEITSNHKELMKMVDNDELSIEDVADTMDMIEGEFNDKAMSLVAVKDNMETDVTAIDAEIKRLTARKKGIKNRQASMIEYLRSNMEALKITNIKCPLFSITLAKGRDIVQIDDESKIHTDYLNIKTSTIPMKKEILATLKAGKKVDGASLAKSKTSIRIK